MFQNIDIHGIVTTVANTWQTVDIAKTTASVEIAKINSSVNIAAVNAQWNFELLRTIAIMGVITAVISFFLFAYWHDNIRNR